MHCSISFLSKALPKDPTPLLADKLSIFPSVSMDGLSECPDRRTASVHAAVGDYSEASFTDKVLFGVGVCV